MALRFFGVISAAMLICLLGLITLNIAFGFGPPRVATVKAETSVVLKLAERVNASGGAAALRRLATDLDTASVRLRIREIDTIAGSCDAFNGTQSRAFPTGQGCIVATAVPEALSWWDVYSPLAIPLGVAILIGALSAIVLARYFSWPLRTVGDKLAALSSGDFSTRIGDGLDDRSDEIGALARAFNKSAHQLQTLEASQKRLFHHVSHEIRSPLARLQVATGVLRRNPQKLDTMLARIEGEVGKLDTLIGQILTLSRTADRELDSLRLQRLDLVELIDLIVVDASFEGEERGIACSYSGPAQLPINGIADLVHSALENIIRNALRHAPDNSAVTITASHGEDHILIEVADQGPGVGHDETETMFEPFFRGATAVTPGGSGLGLAITARVMALHRGRATARNLPQGGLALRLEFPTSDERSR